MKHLKKSLIATAVTAAMLTSTAAMAGVTANVGIASNYVWRGLTQSNNQAAISGGIDYASDMGIYVGTWTSNESWTSTSGYEQDIYAGYKGSAAGIDYNAGYFMYNYPVETGKGTAKTGFNELVLSGGIKGFTLTYAYTLSKEDSSVTKANDTYYSLGYTTELKKGLSLGLIYGSYTIASNDAASYSHMGASISKDDFKFAYDSTSGNGANKYATFTASWSKSFDL